MAGHGRTALPGGGHAWELLPYQWLTVCITCFLLRSQALTHLFFRSPDLAVNAGPQSATMSPKAGPAASLGPGDAVRFQFDYMALKKELK